MNELVLFVSGISVGMIGREEIYGLWGVNVDQMMRIKLLCYVAMSIFPYYRYINDLAIGSCGIAG